MGFSLHHFALPDMYGNGVYNIVSGNGYTVPIRVPWKLKAKR